MATPIIGFFLNRPMPNKTDAGNGSKAICRVSNVLRSPSPDPSRWAEIISSRVIMLDVI